MKKRSILLAVLLTALLALGGCAKAPEEHGLDASKPVTIEVRTYYNGASQTALSELAEVFNNTVGLEKGIFVETTTSGGLGELQAALDEALEKPADERKLPDIFCAYTDMALPFKEEGALADLSQYMTEQELEAYVDTYIEEGRMGSGDELYLFPTAKSTEILYINKTDWDRFAAATGADLSRFDTWEGLNAVAADYYAWTDSLTETPNDGRALFGRDAVDNYMLTGLYQLQGDVFSKEDGAIRVTLDRKALRKLWDNYYVPYISGYFKSTGRFRSDDMKTGEIIAFVGSSSGAAYLPGTVTVEDKDPYNIEILTLPVPDFAGTEPVAVQQGAGMAVARSDEKKEYAASIFLKWLTEAENNCKFAAASSYMPVKKGEADIEHIQAAAVELGLDWNRVIEDSMKTSFDVRDSRKFFWMESFNESSTCRSILGSALTDISNQDRQEVLRQMSEEGKSLAEAVDSINTEAHFNTWCDQLNEDLVEICGK